MELHDKDLAAQLICGIIEIETSLAFCKGELKQLTQTVEEERESLEKFRKENFKTIQNES